ncbi:hypothetical protein M3221_05555 [Domibacillus indicus]|uniref:hypothetical protein n=1 Tax=Domibacillus indicus TaxID=1437523 RepID=UPI0020419873|nr:hypothetical protein [Domibacillus indicus]MCM3787884.1 hypothetical protein [Domibacillus indicus]
MKPEKHIQTHEELNGPVKKTPVIGPGLIVAATGVGAGDLVAALMAGANYGLVFL